MVVTKEGAIQRLSNGIYYRPRPTAFGISRPNPADIQKLAARRTTVFPAGIAAAKLLGFTTQIPKHRELATRARSLPRRLVGDEATIYTRRPEAWKGLSDSDAALLDFLRRRGETSELQPDKTVSRVLKLAAEKGRFERFARIADSEPPRMRALLGAVGEQLGKSNRLLEPLRASLNPLSRFDFGP